MGNISITYALLIKLCHIYHFNSCPSLVVTDHSKKKIFAVAITVRKHQKWGGMNLTLPWNHCIPAILDAFDENLIKGGWYYQYIYLALCFVVSLF